MDNPSRGTDLSRTVASVGAWRSLILDVSEMLLEVPGGVIRAVSIVVPRGAEAEAAFDVSHLVPLIASELGLSATIDEGPRSYLIRVTRRGSTRSHFITS